MQKEKEFSDALYKKYNKKKITQSEYLIVFQELFPQEYYGDDGINLEFLSTLLKSIEEHKLARLPKDPKLWDRTRIPQIPKWVMLNRPKKIREYGWRSYPWREEMAWVSDIPWIDQKTFNDLKVINAVLKDKEILQGKPIPIKERSLLLFKAEKRLDDLIKSQYFREGRLSLEMLNCFQTYEPILLKDYDSATKARAIMIENRDTFFSISTICEEVEPQSPYKYVIYGSGWAIEKAILGIERQYPEIKLIEYFGDLDPPGLRIPIKIRKNLLKHGISVKIAPASRFYIKMITLFQENPFDSELKNPKWTEGEVSFLPLKLQEFARNLFRQRKRIPQEILNYYELKKLLLGEKINYKIFNK
ncbi:MAG: hypothetical protein ACTSQI_12365 [Candidatus Helarchaeota archaeon]